MNRPAPIITVEACRQIVMGETLQTATRAHLEHLLSVIDQLEAECDTYHDLCTALYAKLPQPAQAERSPL